jgi:hypothetical protein
LINALTNAARIQNVLSLFTPLQKQVAQIVRSTMQPADAQTIVNIPSTKPIA